MYRKKSGLLLPPVSDYDIKMAFKQLFLHNCEPLVLVRGTLCQFVAYFWGGCENLMALELLEELSLTVVLVSIFFKTLTILDCVQFATD